MGTLYVLEPDAYISRDGGVIRISRRAGRDVLLERPLAHVTEIVVLGNAVITPAIIAYDTPSDKRRRRMVSVLKSYGERRQCSGQGEPRAVGQSFGTRMALLSP